MKVTIAVRPSGCINGEPWPEVGEDIDLPDAIAKDMIDAGAVKAVKPAAKKAADKVEKRPAATKRVEKR